MFLMLVKVMGLLSSGHFIVSYLSKGPKCCFAHHTGEGKVVNLILQVTEFHPFFGNVPFLSARSPFGWWEEISSLIIRE